MVPAVDRPFEVKLVLAAELSHGYDGSIRLLGDAQRFGLSLLSFAVEGQEAGVAVARLELGVPAGVHANVVRARFLRHPGVRMMEVV